jgi:hypothetical protein
MMAEKQLKNTVQISIRDFLGREYSALTSLYIHHENGATSIFNFYLTLLTTIAGAAIVLLQLSKASIVSILPAIGILIFLSITLGVVVQEAILNKNVDLAYVIQAINLLKFEALKDNREIQEYIDYLHNPFTNKNSGNLNKSMYARLENRLWFLKWVGSHQLFISFFNSLELSFLVLVLVVLIAPGAVVIWQIVIACVIVLFLSLFTHAIYANIEFRRRLRARHLRMSAYEIPPMLE